MSLTQPISIDAGQTQNEWQFTKCDSNNLSKQIAQNNNQFLNKTRKKNKMEKKRENQFFMGTKVASQANEERKC